MMSLNAASLCSRRQCCCGALKHTLKFQQKDSNYGGDGRFFECLKRVLVIANGRKIIGRITYREENTTSLALTRHDNPHVLGPSSSLLGQNMAPILAQSTNNWPNCAFIGRQEER
uniref:Uncharacterized protein n=1 Tax=Timema monikensis TaxID=170555 RepID=A0A7R9HT40_9NEOP|nr:unnamed protein product [Timema monikensis]